MDEHQKKFLKLLRSLESGWSSSILEDFAEASAISLSSAFDPNKEREERYQRIVKRRGKESMAAFPEMLACIINSLMLEGEINFHDALGEICMAKELGRWASDVAFTPFHVAAMGAQMTIGDGPLPSKGYLRLCEPACGTGVMVIAAAHWLHRRRLNYQQTMHVTATEIRAVFAHMAFIQLTLLHIPAVVIHGNSLSREVFSVWYTPAHILGAWGARLRREPPPVPQPAPRGQISFGW